MTKTKIPSLIGEKIVSALSEKEVIQLLESFFQVTIKDVIEQVLEHLDPNTKETIEQVLNPQESSLEGKNQQVERTVSLAKLAQKWSDLWSDWHGIVMEASDEEGRYIEQENHWEPPYFDQFAFAEDLDKVAAQMLPIVQIAFENNFKPNINFSDLLLEAENDILGSLPEWMELYDDIGLEANVTACFLTDQWLRSQAEEKTAFMFAKDVSTWDKNSANMCLEDEAIVTFFEDLPEADKQAIFEGISEHKREKPWKESLKSPYSPWHRIYMIGIELFSPEKLLDQQRENIPSYWQDGLPVIEATLEEKNYQDSLAIVQETLDSLFENSRSETKWDPESELFSVALGSGMFGESSSHKKLLRYYQQTIEGLGNMELARVLSLQAVVFEHFSNWQQIFKAFAESTIAKETKQVLFNSWKKRSIAADKPSKYLHNETLKEQEEWWMHWLIDSIATSEKGKSWFRQRLEQLLTDVTSENAKEHYPYLRLLTQDIATFKPLEQQYPKFLKVVLGTFRESPNKPRQTYLAQYVSDELCDKVLEYWENYLWTMLPQPEQAHKSDYTTHAKWMAALREISPQKYQKILAQWHDVHHRRRNLWKAMSAEGLE